MKYRVEFAFTGSTHYFSEWFDTMGEARQFAKDAFNSESAVVYEIEANSESMEVF